MADDQKLKALGDGMRLILSDPIGTLFNFSRVGNSVLRDRMVAATQMVYSNAQPGNALDGLVAGIQARVTREIRFFDDINVALEGTRSITPRAEASGFSYWDSNTFILRGGKNNYATPLKNRIDERVCLFPDQFNSFGLVVAGLWHEFSHLFTLLHHGVWDISKQQYNDPNSDENRAWMEHMNALKACAPELASDPMSGWQRAIRSGSRWTCNCATSRVLAQTS